MAAAMRPPRTRVLFVTSMGATLRRFVAPPAERLTADGLETIAASGELGSVQGLDRAYELPSFRRHGPAAVLRAYPALGEVVRRERPDLFHVHTPPGLVLGRRAGRRLRIPSVAVAHGTFLEPWGRRALVSAAVEGALARVVQHTVTLSIEDAAFYRRWGGSCPVDVTPTGGMGLDLDRIAAAASHPHRVAAPPSVLVVGPLTADKEPDRCTDATRSILQNFGDSRIRLLDCPEFAGGFRSRNFGLARRRAPLVASLDADGVCEPARLATQKSRFSMSGRRWWPWEAATSSSMRIPGSWCVVLNALLSPDPPTR